MKYGYARVSTIDQNLDGQLKELEAAGCDQIFSEKISGTKSAKDRPELAKLLSQVRTGDHVIVAKVDRAARSTTDLLNMVEDLDRRGVKFTALNSPIDTASPTGKLMLEILGAVATFERSMMIERQRAGIERAKSEGKYTGRQKTARKKADEVIKLGQAGFTKAKIAETLGISQASVYRILKDAKAQKQP